MEADRQKPEGRLVFWAVYGAVVLALLRQVPSAESLSALMFNDDIMRLVEVRDWLGGQGWGDLMQYRMGPDGGTLMHWSRLVDAPIAGIIWLAGLFLPASGAEAAALGVDYLVFCPSDPWLLSLAPEGIWARLYEGDPSPYLTPVLAGGLVVYQFTYAKEP